MPMPPIPSVRTSAARTKGRRWGGPIVKNKTFFFAAVEYMRRDESGQTTIAPSAAAQINLALALHPIPNGGVKSISTGTFPIGEITTLASIKVDQQLQPEQQRHLPLHLPAGSPDEYEQHGRDQRRERGRRAEDARSVIRRHLDAHLFSHAAERDPVPVCAARPDPDGQRSDRSRDRDLRVANFGRNTSYPVLLNETHYEFSQSVSKQTGRHSFKFGGMSISFARNTSFPSTFGGLFSFANLAAFVAGQPQSFTQGFGNPAIHLPRTCSGSTRRTRSSSTRS